MRFEVLIVTLGMIVGIMAGIVILCGAGTEYQYSHHPAPLYGVYNYDNVSHGVSITVFSVNGTHNNTLVCSEIHLLEAGSHEKSSIKNDEGGEFRFEISIDDRVPQEFTFIFQSCNSLGISVHKEREVQAQIIDIYSELPGI